jgi:hypothetical protein
MKITLKNLDNTFLTNIAKFAKFHTKEFCNDSFDMCAYTNISRSVRLYAVRAYKVKEEELFMIMMPGKKFSIEVPQSVGTKKFNIYISDIRRGVKSLLNLAHACYFVLTIELEGQAFDIGVNLKWKDFNSLFNNLTKIDTLEAYFSFIMYYGLRMWQNEFCTYVEKTFQLVVQEETVEQKIIKMLNEDMKKMVETFDF